MKHLAYLEAKLNPLFAKQRAAFAALQNAKAECVQKERELLDALAARGEAATERAALEEAERVLGNCRTEFYAATKNLWMPKLPSLIRGRKYFYSADEDEVQIFDEAGTKVFSAKELEAEKKFRAWLKQPFLRGFDLREI